MEDYSEITDYEHSDILEAYLECALWASIDDDGRPLDDNYGIIDIDSDTIAATKDDISSFMEEIEDLGFDEYLTAEQIGCDFFLTRNGHGTGFWDRGYPKGAPSNIGDQLTAITKPYGSHDFFADLDKGEVYGA